MDKREALEIYLKAHDECLAHSECKGCAFREVFGGSPMCILGETSYTPVAQWIRKNLNGVEEKQEAKSFVPLENVGSIIAHGPSSIKEPIPLPKDAAKVDNVNSPKHYLKGGLECIQVIEAQLTPEQYKGYLYGNVLKYMWRWPDKNGLEDLRKAAKYLEWLQEEVKKNGQKLNAESSEVTRG